DNQEEEEEANITMITETRQKTMGNGSMLKMDQRRSYGKEMRSL
uniref:Uncharacterized protein n=1 Tax=Aegilops tauschii subsp. strangulata TaxID=200361 RepID=A0A453LZW7_AEGTS